jgi:hypothetical protein
LYPWPASAVELIPGKTNAPKMVKKSGNRKTRIKDFDDSDKELIYLKLEEWMQIEIET